MKNITILIFSFLCLPAFSQNWQGLVKVDSAPSWLGGVTAIGNNLYSIPYAYADTIYLPGSAIPVPPYSSCLVKMDNNGNVLFVKPLGKVEARFITHNSENVFITGIYHESFQIDSLSINPNLDSTDIFLACFDTLGNIKWLNKIGNNCYDMPFDVQADQTGNVFLTGKVPGRCNPFNNSRGEFFLSKFNGLGQLIWKKTLDSTMWNPQVNIGTDGAIYLTGCFNDSIRVNDLSNTWAFYANQGGVLVKMDSNLYVDWVKILPRINSAYTVTFKASVDNNQNVYLPVGTLGSFTCDGDTFDGSAIIKFNSSGSISQYMYPGVGTYYPHIKYMPDNTIGVMCKTQDERV